MTLTESAVKALQTLVQRHKLQKNDYYVRVTTKRTGRDEVSVDLNITKKVDSRTDVIGKSKGFRIVAKRSSLPFLEGGKVNFAKHAGFQFHPKKTADEQDGSASKLAVAGSNASDASTLDQAFPDVDQRPSYTSDPYSNILVNDYVGPQACAKCHEEQYNLWRTHPHSKMNRNASSATVVGDFSGVTVDYADGSVLFDQREADYIMTMFRQNQFVRRYKVTRTVGSRIFQMYIGVQTEGPESRDHAIYQEERKLPFAFWIKRQQWFPETYDEAICPEEYDATGRLVDFFGFYTRNFRPIWQESCIWCHNTYPYEARLQKRLVVGFPPRDLSLTQVRHTVPNGQTPDSRWLPESQLVTLGISCESCHFGGREHAIEKREIRFLPCGEHLRFPKATPELITDARKSPYVINAICAQCHAVGQTKFPNKASAWNSGEALDLQSGSCMTAIRCTDCHNPHKAGPQLSGGPDRKEHIDACLQCHSKYKSPAAAAAHARHPASSGVSCLDCHMPRIVHGLHTVTRTHQISSPTDVRMFSKGAPNACNMCHLDRSIRWTLKELQAGWGRKVQPSPSWKKWYGGTLDGPAGMAWLNHPAPMARQVAANAYSRSPLGKNAIPQILPILNDNDPPTRVFGWFAIERILQRQLDAKKYLPWASPATREKQVKNLLNHER